MGHPNTAILFPQSQRTPLQCLKLAMTAAALAKSPEPGPGQRHLLPMMDTTLRHLLEGSEPTVALLRSNRLLRRLVSERNECQSDWCRIQIDGRGSRKNFRWRCKAQQRWRVCRSVNRRGRCRTSAGTHRCQSWPGQRWPASGDSFSKKILVVLFATSAWACNPTSSNGVASSHAQPTVVPAVQ